MDLVRRWQEGHLLRWQHQLRQSHLERADVDGVSVPWLKRIEAPVVAQHNERHHQPLARVWQGAGAQVGRDDMLDG